MSFGFKADAQDWYWVFFTDKGNQEFNPYTFFDADAIERRQREGLNLFDESDVPVNEDYVTEVTAVVSEASYPSRWFNALAVYATEGEIAIVEDFSFVKKASLMQKFEIQPASITIDSIPAPESLRKGQLTAMNGSLLQEAELNGAGVKIAIFDAGFPSVETHNAFRHLVLRNQIVKTWDFVQNHENVYGHSAHGTMVLSCVGGRDDLNEMIGLADGAEYILARTERGLIETYSEEKNWVAALEWADQHGAEIVNSSLGYTGDRYYPQEMDGKTSLVVKAANMARKKGILVLNAIGNDGDADWRVLGTPADSDSILTIGGINPKTNYHISFSSFGPTTHGSMKPNLSAYGRAYVAMRNGSYGEASGTSFATPLVTGFAACARQLYIDLPLKAFVRKLEESGSLHPYYDYAHGFGVPQAAKLMNYDVPNKGNFEWSVDEDRISINILKYPKASQKTEQIDMQPNLYYHYSNKSGVVRDYGVFDILDGGTGLSLAMPRVGETLRIHYNGQTEQISR